MANTSPVLPGFGSGSASTNTTAALGAAALEEPFTPVHKAASTRLSCTRQELRQKAEDLKAIGDPGDAEKVFRAWKLDDDELEAFEGRLVELGALDTLAGTLEWRDISLDDFREDRARSHASAIVRHLQQYVTTLSANTFDDARTRLKRYRAQLPYSFIQQPVARLMLECATQSQDAKYAKRVTKLFLEVYDVGSADTLALLRHMGGTLMRSAEVPSDDSDLSLLHWAVRCFPDRVPQMPIEASDVETATTGGRSPLHYAVLFGAELAALERMLAVSPSNLDAAAPAEGTALIAAINRRQAETVKVLLTAGANPQGADDAANAEGESAIDGYDACLLQLGRARRAEDADAPFLGEPTASQWQDMVTSMETGQHRDAVMAKYDFIVPLSRVLPSLSFFFLFLVFLMGGPLIFDPPKVDPVTGIVESAVTSCLSSFTSGPDIYAALQAINQTNALGRPQWACDLFLTGAVIQSTTLVAGTQHWLNYDTVPFQSFSQLPSDTPTTARVPHALCFAFDVRYVHSKGSHPWRYWVASQLYNQWPMAIPGSNASQEGTPTDFTRAFRHRVIPAFFGKWMKGWEGVVWTALGLCVIATFFDLLYICRSVRRCFGPKRPRDDPSPPTLLPAEGLSGLVWPIASLALEVLVLAYSFAWIAPFVVLTHDRVGDLSYADWEVSEKFVRASASLKLSTLLAAFPGLTFARRIPKPDHFNITNSIAAAGVLIACTIVVELGPVVSIENIVSLVKPETIISMNAAGMAAVLGAFGSALFSRKKDEMSEADRQWYYEQLEQRSYEEKEPLTPAPRCGRYLLPSRFWRVAQFSVVVLGCLAQLALYAVVLFVVISPTLIAAPYGSSEDSDAITGIVTSLTNVKSGE